MSFKNINLKQEFLFFLKSFWTNGFSIWTVVITLTGIFSYNQLICEFREALWFNQLMLVFFVPMIYQIAFRYFIYYKPSKKLKASKSQLKIFFVYFVLAVIVSSIIIEYAYFVVETLLIIPEHHSEARGSNYEVVPWLKAVNWGFIVIFLAGERYRKYLLEHDEIIHIKNENLDTDVQISLIIIGFVLSLSTFVLLHTIMNIPNSGFCAS